MLALERRGIVAGPIADELLGESFVIRHALLRDVGYASLSRAERARLHVRMARWLEGVAADRPDEVAEVIGRHYAAALASAPTLAPDLGDGLARDEAEVLAAGWFERGGLAALAASAYDAASALFARSLELTSPDLPVERARRLTGVARATAFTSDMAAGLEAAEEALALYRECLRDGSRSLDDMREEMSRVVALVGTIYAQQLHFHDVVRLAVDALAELGGSGRRGHRASAADAHPRCGDDRRGRMEEDRARPRAGARDRAGERRSRARARDAHVDRVGRA